MPDEREQGPSSDKVTAPAVNPVIAALEEVDPPTVIIEGFLGTSEASVYRLYHGLDNSSYVEIPKDSVVRLEPDGNGEPGAYRAFVLASGEIVSAQRQHLQAARLLEGLRGPEGLERLEWPDEPWPDERWPSWWTPVHPGLPVERPEFPRRPLEDPYACVKSAVSLFEQRIANIRYTISGQQARQEAFDATKLAFIDDLDLCMRTAFPRPWWPPNGVRFRFQTCLTPTEVINAAAVLLRVTP
jgi:hypothetical protein